MRYDKEADIPYIRLSETLIHHTEVIEEDSLLADVDAEGNIVGVELMDAADYVKINAPMEGAMKEGKVSWPN